MQTITTMRATSPKTPDVTQEPHPWLWPLASLLAGADATTPGETLNRLEAEPLLQDERHELEQTTILLATLRFPWETIMRSLRRSLMLDKILAESSLLPYLQQQARLQGEAEGEARGEARGLYKGELQGLREAVQTA